MLPNPPAGDAPRYRDYEEMPVAGAAALGCHDAQLADFQQQAVAALREHFGRRGSRAGILCLPTGGGKTRTALEWLLRDHVAAGRRVLWIAHRIDLLDQVHGEIARLRWLLEGRRERLAVSRYDGEHDDLRGDVVIASAQSLAARLPGPAELAAGGRPLGVVCFDEAHHAVAPETLKALARLRGAPAVPLLGLTATPFRASAEKTAELHRLFGAQPVFQKSFGELVRLGFLARPVFVRQRLRATEALELSDAERAAIERQGDLTPEVLGRLARDPARSREIVEHFAERAALYGKTLVFACSIAHAEELCALLREQGLRAGAVHCALEDEDRKARLERFRGGADDVLVNVGILTEGANVPDTRTVLMARPTMSRVLYLQMIGRGARGPRAVPGKDRFFVVDCVDNFGRHGVTLAGQEVARELGLSVAEDLPVVRPAPQADVQRRIEQRRHAALALAAAWLRLAGLEDEQYSFFGELAWPRPDGSQRGVAVFLESVGAVEPAVALVREGVTTGRFGPAEEQGAVLDRMGALRATDWMDLVADCKATRRPPVLLAVPGLAPGDEDREAADLVAGIVRAGLERGAAEAQRRAAAFASAPRVRGLFPDAAAFEREVLRLYDQMVTQAAPAAAPPAAAPAGAPPVGVTPPVGVAPPAGAAPPSSSVAPALSATVPAAAVAATVLAPEVAGPAPALRWDEVEAMVALGLAVAAADGQVDEDERRALARGVARVVAAPAVQDRIAALCRAPAAAPVAAAAAGLSRLSWPALLALFDTLVRVAVADGRLAPSERTALAEIGAALGIPREEHERRLAWYVAVDPARPAALTPGITACAVCSAPAAAGARFCSACGAAIGGGHPTATTA
jgi:superfamily II DNA or RNA helicase/uncharacterized tellurite resistance protein B-like protein